MLTDTEDLSVPNKTPRLAFRGKLFVSLTKNLPFAPFHFLKQQPLAPHTGLQLMGTLFLPALGFILCVVVTDLWPGQLLVVQRNTLFWLETTSFQTQRA